MRKITYVLLIAILTSCSAEKLIQMAEKKDGGKDAIMNRGENLSEGNKNSSWPDTIKTTVVAGSYEAAMQDQFKLFSGNTCNCIPQIVNLDKRDFVPSQFRSINPRPYFDRLVEKADRISSLALFYYPFESSELKEFDKVRFDESKLLFTDYYDLTIPIESDRNFTNFFYSSSCSNYLFSSIDGKVSSPIPFASLQAGLKSDNQKQATLICVGGNFKSPLLNELQSTNNELKTNIYLKLWDYYSKPGNNKKLYVLKNFEGVSFNTTLKTDNSFLVNTNGQINFSASLVSVAANIKAGASKTTFFKGTNWTTLIDKEDFNANELRKEKFYQLPTEDEIITHFQNNVKRQSTSDNFDNMFQNYEHQHYSIFRGIPETDRNSDDWEIVIDNLIYRSTPTIEIDKTHSPSNECKFIIKGIPDDALFDNTQNNTINFGYKIQKKNKVLNKSIALNAEKIVVTINKEPLVYDRTVNTNISEFGYNENAENITYKWTFNIRLLDTRSLVKYDKIPSGNCVIVSKDSEFPMAFVGSVSPVATNKEFSFTISSTVPKANIDKSNYSYTTGSVKFNLYIGQQSVERTFNVSLPIFSKMKLIN